MGEEIAKVNFGPQESMAFRARLNAELEQLRKWQRDDAYARGPMTTGLELEAWLLESDGQPSPDNGQFLESLSNEWVVPELAKFNFELNVQPQGVSGDGLNQIEREMRHTWQLCGERAAQLNRRITCIGILPTVTPEMLCIKNMTPRSRFAALNQQILRMRHGAPLKLHVDGIDSLDMLHQDVMLESAATSLQVHLKVPLEQASRYYNAFLVASTATVGLAAGAALVFGRRLWHDSRIPIFEQAVDTGSGPGRVTFGKSYATDDFLALFDEKVGDYPSILPVALEESPERVPHLRLHNGTLWFWNRPLIGFEEDGSPHLRIEHRVMSAGPTAIDIQANVALSLGLAHAIANPNPANNHLPPDHQCPFAVAKDNFYAAARYGLAAEVTWRGRRTTLRDLLLYTWLPMTQAGLNEMQVDDEIISQAMDTLTARTQSGRTAAVWQLQSFERHRGDVFAVLNDYLQNQATRAPVHQWPE